MLRTMTGAQLGPQLFCHKDPPNPAMMKAPSLDTARDLYVCQQTGQTLGGIWTSKLEYIDNEPTSVYVEYGLLAMPRSWRAPRGRWIMMPDSMAHILVIDGRADLFAVLERFPYRPAGTENPVIGIGLDQPPEPPTLPIINTRAVAAAGYDAIHVTQDGLRTCPELQKWIVPSTQFLTWAFSGEPSLVMNAKDHIKSMRRKPADAWARYRDAWRRAVYLGNTVPLTRALAAVDLYEDPGVNVVRVGLPNRRELQHMGRRKTEEQLQLPLMPWTVAERHEWISQALENAHVFAAIHKDLFSGYTIIGSVPSEIQTDHSLDPDTTAYLAELWVEPTQRGRGIGTALLSSALALVRGAGCETVLTLPHTDNLLLIALLKVHGFVPMEARSPPQAISLTATD